MCQLTTQFYIKYIHSFGRLVAYKLFRVWSCWYYYQTLKKQYNLNGTCNIFWILGWNHGSWIKWLCDAWNVMSEYINQVSSPPRRLAAMNLHYSVPCNISTLWQTAVHSSLDIIVSTCIVVYLSSPASDCFLQCGFYKSFMYLTRSKLFTCLFCVTCTSSFYFQLFLEMFVFLLPYSVLIILLCHSYML